MSFESFLVPLLASDAEGIWVLIPLAAISLGGAAIIVKSVIRHRERMAKIGMGIDPDLSPGTDSTHSGGCCG
jgi:hypothetical protein